MSDNNSVTVALTFTLEVSPFALMDLRAMLEEKAGGRLLRCYVEQSLIAALAERRGRAWENSIMVKHGKLKVES